MRITNSIQSLKPTMPVPSETQHLLERLHCPFTQKLDYVAYGLLLKHCTNHTLPRQAKQLHSRIIQSSVTPDSFLASILIRFYSKIDGVPLARHLFDEIPHKNTFSFNSMLVSYVCKNKCHDAIRLFSLWATGGFRGYDVWPNNYTVSCVLKALSVSSCEVSLAKEVHCFVLRCGLVEDTVVVNGLVSYYSSCNGGIGFARRVFDGMQEKDVVSWNSMISGYSQGGFYDECKVLYKEMLDSSGLIPNEVTVASVLQACGQSNDLLLGLEVHRFMSDAQIKVDVLACNALIGMYAKCGSLDYARELFSAMSEKDEVTFGALITGYMFHGFIDKAMDLFHELENPRLSTWNAAISGLFQNNLYEGTLDLVREMQARGFRPNAVTLTSILPTFSYFSNLRGGKEMHSYAIRNHYDQNIYVATAIIDTYSKAGFLHGAQRVFENSKYRSLIIWTAIIAAYAAHGDAHGALHHFTEMRTNGIQPDSVTLIAVLAACTHSSGMVDKARNIFNSMYREYGIQPSMQHYACMVGVLSRAGRLSEAIDFVRKMPIEPSAKVWGPLLHGVSFSGDVELGKFIFDHLFEIEPDNTGSYVIMANLYSRAGRWKEADMIREKMKEIGLKKTPGRSWIETTGGLKSFLAQDALNERSEEIYVVLEGLLGLMRKEGYALQNDLDKETVCV